MWQLLDWILGGAFGRRLARRAWRLLAVLLLLTPAGGWILTRWIDWKTADVMKAVPAIVTTTTTVAP